jgi:hypothetical protein
MISKTTERPTDPTAAFGEEPHRVIDERPGIAAPHRSVSEGGIEPPPAMNEEIDRKPLQQRFARKRA